MSRDVLLETLAAFTDSELANTPLPLPFTHMSCEVLYTGAYILAWPRSRHFGRNVAFRGSTHSVVTVK